MSNNKKFSIGIIGYGVGRLDSWAFKNVPYFYNDIRDEQIDLVGICTGHENTAKKAVDQMGFRFATTNYKELIQNPEIDIVCVTVPDNLHYPIVMEAIKAKKHIYCEKPLAMSVAEGQEMAKAAKAANIVNQVGVQMRFAPAAIEAKKIIDQGLLGRLLTFRCVFLHSGYENKNRPMSWRLDINQTSGGAIADLGSHSIDLMIHLLGDFANVTAMQDTKVKERPVAKGSEQKQKVEVDDITLALVNMKNGMVGTFEVTRLATGIRRGPELTVHGTEGTLQFNAYVDPDILYLYLKNPEKVTGQAGFERLQVGGKLIPLEVSSQYNFLKNVEKGMCEDPNFATGLKTLQVIEGMKRSAQKGEWVNIP